MKIVQAMVCLTALLVMFSNASAQVIGVSEDIKQNAIENVAVSRAGGSTIIKLGLRQPLEGIPSNFSIANPARIVFDFPATTNGLGFSSKSINDAGLRSVNVVEADGRTRLVLNLEKLSRFETRTEGANLFISLNDDIGTPAAVAPAQQFVAVRRDSGSNGLTDVQFRRAKDGAGVVVVDMSSTDAGIDVKQKGNQVIVVFKNSRLPDSLRRRLDVADFSTPVNFVNTKVVGEDVVLEVVPKGLWEHVAFQSDNQFIVEVRPVKEDPNRLFQGTRGGFQGEPISLNFQNIPLRELLHVFADITSFNIVVSDTVAGNVSLRLNDVPWDQALEIVLQQKALAMRKNGNVIWIAPADELAAKEKATLESKQQIADLEPLRTEKFVLNYHQAEELKGMIMGGGATKDPGQPSVQASFLSARGTVAVDKRTNTLFITDAPSALDRVKDLISALDRPARQVLIEARIVEAEDSFSSSIGARLGTTDRRGGVLGHRIIGGDDTRFAIGNNFAQNSYNTGQADISDKLNVLKDGASVNLPASSLGGSPAGTFSLSLFDRSKTMFLNLELSALEFDGRGKVVSSPRVVTADKVKAVIKHGTEIPYVTVSATGGPMVTYRQAVLMLEATPVITPDDKVRMELKITKDSPNTKISTNYGVAIDKKEVTTEVMVENGGTLVIGGIFTQTISNNSSRIPVLGDIPYVGFLFKQQTNEDKRTELLVFITPKIVSDQIKLN